MKKVEGDIRSKRLLVYAQEETAREEVARALKQIGYPVES